MRRTLTDDGANSEFEEQFRKMRRSAWRWEQQPVYEIGFEQPNVEAFLAGNPQDPMADEGLAYWFRQVAGQVAEGKTIGRVRVIEEPPTDYQRWERWLDKWNTAAGERIQYLTRSQAGMLPPAPFGAIDWWIFDDEQVMLIHSDSRGKRTKVELLIDEPEVEAAKLWRDRAIEFAAGQNT